MSAPPVVLVVEDNSELRHVLKEVLTAEGYAVVAARDEVEALEILRAQHVDLYISDLTDPKGPPVTLEAVRDEFPKLPVVALAGALGQHPSFFFSAWDEGVRTLSKPFRMGELLAVSRDLLGSSGPSPTP